jgi:hypothetical protein
MLIAAAQASCVGPVGLSSARRTAMHSGGRSREPQRASGASGIPGRRAVQNAHRAISVVKALQDTSGSNATVETLSYTIAPEQTQSQENNGAKAPPRPEVTNFVRVTVKNLNVPRK